MVTFLIIRLLVIFSIKPLWYRIKFYFLFCLGDQVAVAKIQNFSTKKCEHQHYIPPSFQIPLDKGQFVHDDLRMVITDEETNALLMTDDHSMGSRYDQFWPSLRCPFHEWVVASVTRSQKLFQSMWPSAPMKTCPIVKHFCHSRINILPNNKRTLKFFPSLLKLCQSGTISPNLVTLVVGNCW